mmetsp:Transcript_27320/g.63678  ORF Transcript_27320/g.63678 Transcript_27320/m.63678 type:complete len:202 (-) Transcript_27320:74-679(-)
MADERMLDILRAHGYRALSQKVWAKAEPKPKLALNVTEHIEIKGHTCYCIHCGIFREDGRETWVASLRLAHLRELRKVLKQLLGNVGYLKLFPDYEDGFALRGAPPGTSKRLDQWLKRLAYSANQGLLNPVAVYRMLLFLQAPASPLFADTEDDLPLRSQLRGGTSSADPAPDDAFSIGDDDSESDKCPQDEAPVPTDLMG